MLEPIVHVLLSVRLNYLLAWATLGTVERMTRSFSVILIVPKPGGIDYDT